MEEEDRISELPEHILHHHILSLLPQKDAVRTCILSKSWRYLGPTRPKLEFHESSFAGDKQTMMSVMENTLQRYDVQNLPLQEFILGFDKYWIWHDLNWIPIVIKKMGVKTFNLTAHYFDLPSVVLESEFLVELYLKGCKLDRQINNNCINVKLQKLKRLSLHEVYIHDETFEKIMSCCCPLIENLVLDECYGLTNVKVNKARNLRHFYYYRKYTYNFGSIEIDGDAQSLQTIHIEGGPGEPWFILHSNNYIYFPRLNSLYLHQVHLPTKFLNNLSSDNCPCLEELQLHLCSGFSEFELSNRSIKRLIIRTSEHPIEVIAIDTPNMLYFKLMCSNYPPSISFATTSREWKSCIEVSWDSKADVLSTWYLKLHEFLKALSQSQIFLDIYYLPLTNYDGGSFEPVVVEFFWLREEYLFSEIPNLLNCLFRTCRPRYIDLFLDAASSQKKHAMAESIWRALGRKVRTWWKQDLEYFFIQVCDKNTNEWRTVQVRALPNNERIRFRLKWRDSS